MRGLFFVFEGIDGSGQDTQAGLLQAALEKAGHRVWLTREPTDGHIGKSIKRILRGEIKSPGPLGIQNMMVMDRSRHVAEIQERLKTHKVVICVRYFYSTLAYGLADGLNYLDLWRPNERFRRPQLAIYLDVDPAISMQRVEQRGQPLELFERREFLAKVRANFCKMIADHDFAELKLVPADADIAAVHQKVMALVRPFLK